MTEHTNDPIAAGFQRPEADEPLVERVLDVDELLSTIRRVTRTARIFLRGDLVAERDELLMELRTLVDAEGNVIEDPEAALGEQPCGGRAQELAARLVQVERGMHASARFVRFEGMPSDEWPSYMKAHFPKGEKPDTTEFSIGLIARTAVSPTLTADQVRSIRSQIGSSQWRELADRAWESCTEGGVDVPKSPSSLLNLARK